MTHTSMFDLPMFDLPTFPEVNPCTTIPHKIYQTWDTKELPADMAAAVQSVKDANPGFEHFLYDDNDCRHFIEAHFPPEILAAFNTLIPGAFKADLWRYCILYIQGGIYLDIKFVPVNGFQFKTLIESEQLCKDRPEYFKNMNGVYNACMILAPGNIYMKQAILTIYKHVKEKNYGVNGLYITGPGLLSEIIPCDYTYSLFHKIVDSIHLNDTLILQAYPTYRTWTQNYYTKSKKEHYGAAWLNKRVFT